MSAWTTRDAEVRALACDAAARTGDASVVERLFALLADPHARVAQAALAAIQGLGGSQTEALALQAAAPPTRGAAGGACASWRRSDSRSAY